MSRFQVLRLRVLASLDERSSGLLVIAGASYLARLGSALTFLLTIPLARRMLDSETFGIWMMLSSLLPFFAFADLGVGNGILNRMTAAQASGHQGGETLRAMAAGYACTFAFAIGLSFAWFCWVVLAAEPIAWLGEISAPHRAAVLSAANAFVLLAALNLPASLIQKIQLGSQQGHWVGMWQFAASAATVVAVPLALFFGGSLTALVLASLGMQVLANLANSVWWLHRDGHLAVLWLNAVDRQEVTALLRAGVLFFFLQLAVEPPRF